MQWAAISFSNMLLCTYIEQIPNKAFLCSAGNYPQYFLITYKAKGGPPWWLSW